MKTKLKLTMILLTLGLANAALASDHDDGETELKGRNLNITDVYAFRESSQTGKAMDSNLVLVMNTNPRSLPGQEYFFSTKAKYTFHISRVAKKTAMPTGSDDVKIDIKFDKPDAAGHQAALLEMNRVIKGRRQTMYGFVNTNQTSILTTTIAESKSDRLTLNEVWLGNQKVKMFAGLREDPFYFDVERFFKLRSKLAETGGKEFIGFRAPAEARDFTKDYNVNSIVLSLPLKMLQASNESVFDVWTTISIGDRQIERLARPAINEGLVLTNKSLNAFNMIAPADDLSRKTKAILGEAGAVLGILANLGGQPAAHVGAVVNGFLPDVMRIDASKTIPVGTAGYTGDFVINDAGAPMLTGGRKIEDDVIDATLTYLVFGADGLLGPDPNKKVSDGVSYKGADGNNSQGHRMLLGQSDYNGAAMFPYLATPH